MTFEILCMATIALLFGLVVAFGGYRLFLILLPVWGFFAGFMLGAQTIHFLFDVGLFATVTGWVVGFFVGLLFAVLSYLFYFIAVGIVSFSLGYGASVAVLLWIGLEAGFLVWLIAFVVGQIAARSGTPLEPAIGLDSILLATIFSAAVGLFFGIYPANRAANLEPVEALRYE